MGLAILLSAKSCCRLSWERWLHFLHQLGPVLLGCCRLQLSSLSSVIVLHFFAKDGVVILCVCLGTVQYWWISIGLVVVQLRAEFCPLVQYLSLFCEAFSSTILYSCCFPCFTVVKSFTSWYALLQLFFLRFSLFSLSWKKGWRKLDRRTVRVVRLKKIWGRTTVRGLNNY